MLSNLNRPWKRVRHFVAVALALIVLVASGGMVWAETTDNLIPTHGGPSHDEWCHVGNKGQGLPCQTDNRQLSYFMQGSLEHGDKVVVNRVMKTQYAPTVFVRHHPKKPKYHGSGETDIIYREHKVPSGLVGYTGCNDPLPKATRPYACDQQYVTIKGGGWYHRDGLVCHETGHAVGLTHGADANPRVSNQKMALRCMRTPATHPDDKLGTNNQQNINQTY